MENENKEKGKPRDSITKVFAAVGRKREPSSEGSAQRRIRPVPQIPTPNYLKVVLLVLVVLAVAAVITLLAVHLFYRPAVDTGTPFDTGNVTESPVTDPKVTEDVPPDTTEPVPVGPVFTRNTDSVNFLVMGMDKMSASTDVIMIVNFDINANSISIVQLPRDTYVECNDGKTGRINAIYAHYINASPDNMTYKQQRRYAMEKTAESIEAALCIQIDYYALVYLDVFKEIVDEMGGVYVDVPFDMYYVDDTPGQELYVDLKAGYQLLDGDKAEQFIRFRADYKLADISRMDAQKLFISAMFKQLKQISVTQAVNIAKSVLGNLTTDVEFKDAQYYVTKLFGVDLSKITMLTMAGDGCRTGSSGAWMYVLSRAAALDTVNRYLNVYNEDITEDIFDSGKRLTNTEDSAMMQIYNSDMRTTVVNGENANDKLDFPHYED